MSKETEKPVNRTTIKRKEQAIVEKLYQEFWRRGLVSREEQIYFPSQSFIPYRGKRISRKSHGRELTV